MPTFEISRRKLLSGGGAIGLATLAGTAAAQRLPKRLTLVVPNAAGGSADIMARLVGQRLGEILDGSTVIDNRGEQAAISLRRLSPESLPMAQPCYGGRSQLTASIP